MKSQLVKNIFMSNKICKKQSYINMYKVLPKVLPKVNKKSIKQNYLNMYKVLPISKRYIN